MWIDLNINSPPDGAIVLVKMADGTPDGCYAVAEYSARYGFEPVNCESTYDGAGDVVLSYKVIAWKYIEED